MNFMRFRCLIIIIESVECRGWLWSGAIQIVIFETESGIWGIIAPNSTSSQFLYYDLIERHPLHSTLYTLLLLLMRVVIIIYIYIYI
jgi:hypothetical protein